MIATGRVNVTTTPTLVCPQDDHGGHSVSIYNAGNQSVYIGSESVTPLTGYEMPKGTSFSAKLSPEELIFGVVALGSEVVLFITTHG